MNPYESPQTAVCRTRVRRLNWSPVPMVCTFASLLFIAAYGFAAGYSWVNNGVYFPLWPLLVGCLCYWGFKFSTEVLLTVEWNRSMKEWEESRP